MLTEFFRLLSDWNFSDTQIVLTGSFAAMSCALPGAWLFLRRQSLLGDALSHSILPGIVLAYLAMHSLTQAGWKISDSGLRHLIMFLGATAAGVLSAVMTELIQRWGRLDRGAAIGVVFTTMFAFGLLLIRMFADKTHVDPNCVLYGNLEAAGGLAKSTLMTPAAVSNARLLAINGLMVILFFKELRLSTFDPGLATTVGVNSNWIQVSLMAMTAATLVAAFESVGAILVISMLIVPPATARLLTDRLGMMMVITLVIAALSAVLGNVGALTVPKMIFSRLGYTKVEGASTTGMMAVASGCLFVLAILCSPRHGVVRRILDQFRLQIRITSEDILGQLYRRDESRKDFPTTDSQRDAASTLADTPGLILTIRNLLARRSLYRKGLISDSRLEMQLTEKGRELARNLVRSHRLWEAYMARHFALPGDHLHATAAQVEHFLSPELQTELAAELDQPALDPHGKSIPGSSGNPLG